MKVLVTGASGFIGTLLTKKLISDGVRVCVLTRYPQKTSYSNVQVHVVDLSVNNPPSLLRSIVNDCDAIIHCAGEIRDSSKMYALHVEGTKQLLDAFKVTAINQGVTKHWVQLSSVGAYGPSDPPGLVREITEESPLKPKGEYEVTKTLADQLVIQSADRYMSYSILRPSNVVGAGMTNLSFLTLIKNIQKKMFFYIGSRDSISNYVHVEDVCTSLLLCLNHPDARNNVFNLSNDCNLSAIVRRLALDEEASTAFICLPETLVRLVSKLFGSLPLWPLTKNRIDALVSRTRYPAEKLRKLGFNAGIDIPDFAVTYSNYNQHKALGDSKQR